MPDQVKYTQKLKDAKVLVIGGSSGIGYAVAEALIENGCYVTISASNPDKAKKTVEKLLKSYPSAKERVKGDSCNLGDEATLEKNIQTLLENTGEVDHIVHTAGDPLAMMKLEEANMEKIKKAGMVRFFSPLILAKYAPKYLTGGPNSSITLTTGAVSEHPMPNWSIIGSYATGLQGMARQLALDLKPIRVNVVSPGAVETELWDSSYTPEQKKAFIEQLAQKLPTGRVPGPEDIAESYLYVMKDRNITGAMISTSGGHLLI